MDEEEKERKRRAQLRLIVEKVSNLPTLPEIVVRIAEMVDSPQTTGKRLGAEIASDQVISAKVLKLVNSGFYGFSQPIATIPHAVSMLGFNAVKSLVLSCSVLDSMNEAFPGLWEHSLACARTCALIADQLGMSDPEELSTIGLLHDLGKVVIYQTLEEEFIQIRLRVEENAILVYKAEEQVLGVDHGQVGGWLLERWALPAKLTAPIAEHHDFQPRRPHAERAALVHLADILCRAEAFGNGGDRRIPRLHPTALTLLEMTIDEVGEVMARMEEGLTDIQRM